MTNNLVAPVTTADDRPGDLRLSANADPLGHRFAAVEPGDNGHSMVVNLAQFVPYKVSRLANYLSRSLAHLYEGEFGLSVTEWRLIAIVARYGECSAIDVCRDTAMDKVRVSRAVASAIEKGLLTRTSDDRDRRRWVLRLTDKGNAVHEAVVPKVVERQRDILGGLSNGDVETLFKLLDRLTMVARALPGAQDSARSGSD